MIHGWTYGCTVGWQPGRRLVHDTYTTGHREIELLFGSGLGVLRHRFWHTTLDYYTNLNTDCDEDTCQGSRETLSGREL